MKRLYVATHPESRHHRAGLVGGWHDSELTERGLIQAARIADRISGLVPDGAAVDLFSSDLQRAAQTAQVIAERLGVEPTYLAGLREKSYGDAEGRQHSWLDERFVPPPPGGDRMNHDEGIDGSETKLQFASRIYDAVGRILASPGPHHVVVTHGFALTFVVATARWCP